MSPGQYSSCSRWTSSPTQHNHSHQRREDLNTPVDGGVFGTLYCPDTIKRRPRIQTPAPVSHRHSSYNPVGTKDIVTIDLCTIDESPKIELKQFDEAFAKYKEGKSANTRIETEKYFDNLVEFIEEAAKGLG